MKLRLICRVVPGATSKFGGGEESETERNVVFDWIDWLQVFLSAARQCPTLSPTSRTLHPACQQLLVQRLNALKRGCADEINLDKNSV